MTPTAVDERQLTISAAQREILSLVKGYGIRGRDLAAMAPNLLGLLRQAYGGLVSPELAIAGAIDALARRDAIAAPSRKDASSPRGAHWAEILRMLFNVGGASEVLGKRQQSFDVPASISSTYNVTTTTSSRFRNDVCRDAALIFADFVYAARVASSPADDPIPLLPTVIEQAIDRQIGAHSYVEQEWVSALSGQYFLILLGRLLGQDDRRDYRDLLDIFLASFNPRSDDTLVLNERNVLVTPDELARMKQQMIEEDVGDSHFTRTARTKAENIDSNLLHKNYLYGLILGIAARSATRTMRSVHDIALEHLANGRGPARDPAGGWVPYRIPWITARILLSLRELQDDVLTDEFRLTIETACKSLLARRLPDNTWRSGVGTWVTLWESTGLCLEALLAWPEYCDRASLQGSLEAVWARRNEWLVPPDLTSEDGANATLAASVLCADLLVEPLSEDSRAVCLRYLASVLLHAEEVAVPTTRQYCTVPQIVYYAAKAMRGSSDV